MADADHRPQGPYVPHSLSDLTAGMPPPEADGAKAFPILADKHGAISQPEQLQALLGLQEPPKTVQTTTVPDQTLSKRCGPDSDAPDVVDVYELTATDYSLLSERAVLEDGPMVISCGEQLLSRRVSALIPAAYPPRSLNHAQTCDATTCRRLLNEQSLTSPTTSLLTQPQSQSQSQSSWAAWVLGTPELLELILYHVDLKTRIISAPRVCRFWSQTIAHSPTLRKVSFFQTEHSPTEASGERPRINTLLVEAFGHAFFDDQGDHQGEKRLFRRAEYFWKLPWSSQALINLKAETGSVLQVDQTCRQRSFTRAGASWRRMLVSQPPPPFIGFIWLDCFPRSEAGHRFEIDSLKPQQPDAGGVTMGQLYDTVQFLTMQQQKPGLFFRIRWDLTCERMAGGGIDPAKDDGVHERSNLVAEFWDDPYFNSSHYGPFSMEATRDAFQCEEVVKPSFAGQARLEGFDADAPHDVPPNDEFELWEPLAWTQ